MGSSRINCAASLTSSEALTGVLVRMVRDGVRIPAVGCRTRVS